MRQLLTPTSLILFATLLAACTPNPNGLNSNHIREQAIQESALSYGAQSALAWQSHRIQLSVDRYDQNLDHVFNFASMMLPNHVMPPIITESRQSLHLADPNAIRLADRIIEIIQPAQFVTTIPRWQTYLDLNYPPPTRPSPAMLPGSAQERQIWDQNLQIGWHNGIEQANTLFNENLNRLVRDLTGMGLYRSLLAQNMVSPPYVASATLGVTGDQDQMRLNDQVLRITARSNLLPNQAQKWRPALVPTPQDQAVIIADAERMDGKLSQR